MKIRKYKRIGKDKKYHDKNSYLGYKDVTGEYIPEDENFIFSEDKEFENLRKKMKSSMLMSHMIQKIMRNKTNKNNIQCKVFISKNQKQKKNLHTKKDKNIPKKKEANGTYWGSSPSQFSYQKQNEQKTEIFSQSKNEFSVGDHVEIHVNNYSTQHVQVALLLKYRSAFISIFPNFTRKMEVMKRDFHTLGARESLVMTVPTEKLISVNGDSDVHRFIKGIKDGNAFEIVVLATTLKSVEDVFKAIKKNNSLSNNRPRSHSNIPVGEFEDDFRAPCEALQCDTTTTAPAPTGEERGEGEEGERSWHRSSLRCLQSCMIPPVSIAKFNLICGQI